VAKDKDKATGLYFCPGSIGYAGPCPDPYHLKTPDDTYCYASQKLWKQLRLLLSLKWQERKEQSVAQLPLQTLINSTNWFKFFFYVMLMLTSYGGKISKIDGSKILTNKMGK
jgi:hypothetical protein